MEQNYQGDLTDILRASSGASGYGGSSSSSEQNHNWVVEFPFDPAINFSSAMEEPPRDRTFFGDPFSNIRDPLLHELDITGSGFFSGPKSSEMIGSSSGIEDSSAASGYERGHLLGVPTNTPPQPAPPSNIFSRMLQINPSAAKLPLAPQCESPAAPLAMAATAASPTVIKPAAMASSDMINVNSSQGCLVDNTRGGVQISSPRNPAIKRRKSQAKKVVCIPAPAAANSRASGEVVPSDLWAWRKYGQKPIKGSPYPRGYYRCSSSKGCSARKQVERSRADPNMLVITYTSEHNHPWPTQRNALAGSTRSQPKGNNSSSKTSSNTNTSTTNTTTTTSSSSPKEEQNAQSFNNGTVKEEIEDVEKQLVDQLNDGEFPYRPSMAVPPTNSSHEDFFADLGEIETDPLNLLFSQGFDHDHQKGISKGLDPFNLFDWSGGEDNNTRGL
ncbi:hypothetical protein UlMin_019514 [Ulmus minor]